jgi:predicted aspartyl protease
MGDFRPLALILLGLAGAAPCVAESCDLKIAELAVTMSGLRPIVHARINGSEALFIADSGAFYNSLTAAAAAQYHLHLEPAPYERKLSGVGGDAQEWLTTVRTFSLLNVDLPDMTFVVGSNELGEGVAGLIGQNIFRSFGDVEYDLAHNVIRLVRTRGCGGVSMAYWAKSQPAYDIDIDPPSAEFPHTTGRAYVNGAEIRVLFDTGANHSLLTLDAAKRAGVTPDSPGVVRAGEVHGVGPRGVRTWVAPFVSFRIGNEEVRNTHLRVGDLDIRNAHRSVDMLLGADFFLSHHIYVANSQRKLYFTYNGGPVFNLTSAPAPGAASTSAPPASAGSDPSRR